MEIAGLGAVDDLVADQDQTPTADQRREQADAEEQPVAEAVGLLAAGARAGRAAGGSDAEPAGRGGAHRRAA